MPSPGFDPFEGDEDEYDPDDEEPIPDDEIDEPPDEEDPYDSMNEMNEKYEGEMSMAMMEENKKQDEINEAKMTVSNVDPSKIPPVSIASVTAAFDEMKQLGKEKMFILEQCINAQYGHTMSRAEAYALIQKLGISEGDPAWAMYVGYLKASNLHQKNSHGSGKIDPYCFACGGHGMPKAVSALPPCVVPAPCTKCYDHIVGMDVFASLKDIETLKGQTASMTIIDEMEEYKEKVGIEQFCGETFNVDYHALAPNQQKEVEKEYVAQSGLTDPAQCQETGEKHSWSNHPQGGHVCNKCGKLTTIAKMIEDMKKNPGQIIQQEDMEVEASPGVTVKPLFDAQNKINVKNMGNSVCKESEKHEWIPMNKTVAICSFCKNQMHSEEFVAILQEELMEEALKDGVDLKKVFKDAKAEFKQEQELPYDGQYPLTKEEYDAAIGQAKKEESSYCSHSSDEQHNWHDDMSGTLMCACGATKVKGDVPEFPTQLQQSPPTICVEFGTKHEWGSHPTLKNTCACGTHKKDAEFTKDGYCNVCMGYDWKHAKPGCKGTFTSYEDAKVKGDPSADVCPMHGAKHVMQIYSSGKYACKCGVTPEIAKPDVKLINTPCPSYHPNGPKHQWEILTLSTARCSNCHQAVTSENFVGNLSIQNPEAMKKWIQLDKDKKKWQMETPCANHVQEDHKWVAKDATTIKCILCNAEIEGSELVNKVIKGQIEKAEDEPGLAPEVKWYDAKCPHYPQKKHNWEIQNLTRVWCIQCTETLDGVSVVEELVASHFKHAKKYAALVKAAQLKGQPTLKVNVTVQKPAEFIKATLKLGGGLMDTMKEIKYGDPCPGTITGDHHWDIHPASDQHIQCGACKLEVPAPEIAKKFLKKKYGAYSVQEKSFDPNAPKLSTKEEQAAMIKKLGELVAKETKKQVMGKVSPAKAEEIGKSMAQEMADQIEKEVLGLQDTTTHEEIKCYKVPSANSETGVFSYLSPDWHIYRISPEIVEISSKKPGHEHTGFARYFKFPDDWRVKSVTATYNGVGMLKGMGIKITDDTDEIMSLAGTSIEDAAGITHPIYCCACNGWGKDLNSSDKPSPDCPACKGVGVVQNTGEVGLEHKCGICEGFGQLQTTIEADGTATKKKCGYCKGTGKAKTPATYSENLKMAEWIEKGDEEKPKEPKEKEPELKYQKMVASEFIGAGSLVYVKDDGSIGGIQGQGDEPDPGMVIGLTTKGALEGDVCEVNVTSPENIPSFTEDQIDVVVAQMKGWEKHEPCGCLDDTPSTHLARLKDATMYAIHPSVPGGVSSHAAVHVDHLAHHLYGHKGIIATQGPPMEVKQFKAGHKIEKHMLVTFLDGQMGKTYGQARRFEAGDNPVYLMGYAMHTVEKGKMVAVAMMKIPNEAQKHFEGPVLTSSELDELVKKSQSEVPHYYPTHTCYYKGKRIQFTSAEGVHVGKGTTVIDLDGYIEPVALKQAVEHQNEQGLYPPKWTIKGKEFIITSMECTQDDIPVKTPTQIKIRGQLVQSKGKLVGIEKLSPELTEKAIDMTEIKPTYLEKLEKFCKTVYNVEFSALNEKNKNVVIEQMEKAEKKLGELEKAEKKLPKEPSDEEMEKFCWATYGEYFHKMNLQKQILMKIEYAKTEHNYAMPQQKPGKTLEDMSLKVGPVRIKGGKFEHLEDLDGWHHEKEGVALKHDGKVVMRIRGDGKVVLDEDHHFLHDMSTPLAKEFVQALWLGVSENNPFLKRYKDALAEMAKQEDQMAKLYKIIGHFALRDERLKQRTEGDPMVARFQNIAQHLEDESSGK